MNDMNKFGGLYVFYFVLGALFIDVIPQEAYFMQIVVGAAVGVSAFLLAKKN